MRLVSRILPALTALLVLGHPAAAAPDDLPDIGNSAGTVLSDSEENKIGRMIMRQLREAGGLVTDPLVNEYIQSVGNRLSQHAHEGDLNFTFFVIDDPTLNAFALPGGFVGVHSGLLLTTANENELAGVLAHEIAHVSQRHIVRGAEAQSKNGLVATAAMVAAILVGAATGADGDAISAAIAVAQGSAIQQRINFTRANEYEADRVGIGFLADGGFDPLGMPAFFETMSRKSGAAASAVPEFFRTHPVTSNRIAESRDRALRYPPRAVPSSEMYELAKSRMQVLTQDTAVAAVNLIESRIKGHPDEASFANRYAYSLALLRSGRATEANEIARSLKADNGNLVAYHTLLGQTQIAAGDKKAGLKTLEDALQLFPRNVPLTTAYANALMEQGDPARAHEIMIDLINNVRYNEDQIRLLALAASAEGDAANAHYYMSEFHVLRGELFMAIDQLKLTLATADANDYQIARAEARMEEITKYLPKKRRRRPSEDAKRNPARR